MMNIENLKTKAEADISEYITKKIIELKKKTGKEVTSIQFTVVLAEASLMKSKITVHCRPITGN